jgi:AcrR family transcriptional regulator
MTNAQERKAQERQARRRRIQEAARTVFSERGYAGASIELIARAAQLSVGAIYLYFRSKEDLYVSLVEDTLTVFDVEMGQVRETVEVSKRLRQTWQLLVTWAEKDAEGPRILRLLAQPAVRPQLSDEVVAAVQAGIGRIQDHIGACVADGIHAGIYRQVNAREIADLAWSALLGSLDAAEMHVNLGLATEPLATRTDRALGMIESALAPQVGATLRAVALAPVADERVSAHTACSVVTIANRLTTVRDGPGSGPEQTIERRSLREPRIAARTAIRRRCSGSRSVPR